MNEMLPSWEITKNSVGERKKQIDNLIQWTIDRLDELVEIELNDFQKRIRVPGDDAEFLKWRFGGGWQVDEARAGNIEPLKKLYPALAEFLVAPKPRKRRKRPRADRVAWAVEDVKRIREIWKKHYKKRNRPETDPVSAVNIAAIRHGVEEEDVRSRSKRSGKKKRNPARIR